MKKRIIALLLTTIILLSLISCTQPQETSPGGDTNSILDTSTPTETQKQTQQSTSSNNLPKVTINNDCLYLMVGDTVNLNFDVDTAKAKSTDITWNTSTDCVSVKNGIVIAKKEGYSYVSANGGNSCLVCVIPKNMAKLSITSTSAINSTEVYIPCTVSLTTDNTDFCFEGIPAEIRLRGNSTSGYAKKPYRIKFNTKRNVLGMNGGAECKSWVLLAEWLDASMLRNTMALSMASMMLGEYSSDWRYVSLDINGTYNGVYVICEQSQINSDRIDIEEAGFESAELMSGYLFEVDASPPYESADKFKIYHDSYDIYDLEGEQYTWTCNDEGKSLQYIALKNEGYSEDQFLFAKYYLRSVFEIIYMATYKNEAYVFSKNFLDKPELSDDFLNHCRVDNKIKLVKTTKLTPQQAIEAVVDTESLARMYLFSELICNSDDLKKSFYMWVDFSEGGTGKLTFGCPWDHDGAIVEWNTYNYQPTDEYFAAKRNPWYTMIMCNDWFVRDVKTCWQDIYQSNNGFSSNLDLIPLITNNYAAEFEKDAQKWPAARVEDQREHSENTKAWLKDRIDWLNLCFGEKS